MKHSSNYLLQGLAAAVLVIFAIVIAGRFDLYDRIQYVDKTSHFVGGLIVAWFFSVYFRNILISFSKFERVVILVACVCLVGVFWEFAEYLSRAYSSEYIPVLYKYFRIGSMADTLGDLAMDMIGGLVFGLFYHPKTTRAE